MLSLFLAKRFYKNIDGKEETARKASPPALRIAIAGIAVGLAVMIISLCVVRGFQNAVREKLLDFSSHVEVLDINSLGSPETYPIAVNDSMLRIIKNAPKVVDVQRVSKKMGIIKTENDFAAIMLKGVSQSYDTRLLRKYLICGRLPKLSDTQSSNDIVLSQSLANKLGLKLGDKVYSYYFSNTIKQRRFKVVGIFNTYLKQFDASFVITDLCTVNQLNNWKPDQVSALEVRLATISDTAYTVPYLSKEIVHKTDRYNRFYSLLTIKQNPNTASVLSWLDLLDKNIIVILVIMICVAGFTMISGLLILILERTTTIGLLKTMGASNARIRCTFLWYASFIILKGLLIGNVIGLTLIAIQKYFHVFKLNPEVYYVPYAPVDINWYWIIGINLTTLAVTMIALVLPSMLISRIQPAKSIQFD